MSNFFRSQSYDLTQTQKLELDRELLERLARRAALWVGTLFVASILVLLFGVEDPKSRYGISTLQWASGLWVLLLFYGYLLSGAIRLPRPVAKKNIQLAHLVWCGWVAVVASWWMVGALTLSPPVLPPPSPPKMIFGEMTFIFLTLTGQIITIVLLSASRLVTLNALVIGYLLPFWFFVINKEFPFPIQIWVSGQLFLYILTGWLIGTDQRHVCARGVWAEAERTRANTFTAAISHDLRQPLTTLALRLSLLKEKAIAPEVLADIKFLQRQTEAIGTMVIGTLDLSRLQAGTWEVQVRPVAVNYVIEEVVSDLQADALAKNIRLEVRTLGFLVLTDRTALERILRNLIGNALRYTDGCRENNQGTVLVECEVQGEEMRVSVSDNGVGIPKGKLDDIFKEYVQLDNPERDSAKGLGLGLSIVKGLSSILGHKLAVESTFGKGSRFSVFLPVVGPIPAELLSHGQAQAGSAPDLNGLVVILVEDAPGPREMLSDCLMEWGCYVVAGESAREVIETLRSHGIPGGPHFIIADYRLREHRTGVSAIQEIRDEVGLPKLPAAIWTAETAPKILQEIESAGLPMIAKPPNLQVLQELLLRHRPLESSVIESSVASNN